MKNQIQHLIKPMLLISALVTTLACGKSSSSNPQNTGAYVVCNNGSCSAQVVNPSASYGFYGENYLDQNMTISNRNAYKQFLKDALGVCDRMQNTYGYASCDQWVGGGFDVVIQGSAATSNTLTAIFRVWPQPQSPYYSYSFQAPSFGEFIAGMFGFPVFSQTGAVRNPLVLNFPIKVSNNYQGFEARGNGDYYTTANRSLIQLISKTGKLTDNQIPMEIAFGNSTLQVGTVFATGTMYRCHTAACSPVSW